MSFLLITRRAAAFIRTCLPADPSSWLLLVGSTLLFISLSLRWWALSSFNNYRTIIWAGYSRAMSLPIFAAGVMGYYLAFVGCKNPARRLLDSVLLPTAASLVANLIVAFFWFRDEGEPAHFATQLPGPAHLWEPRIVLSLAVSLGTGFQFASIGFILVAVFFVLYSWGRATLPIHLPPASLCDVSAPEDEHLHSMFFVWMMIAMIFLARLPEMALTIFSDWIYPIAPRLYGTGNWFPLQLINTCAQLVIVLFAVGKSGRMLIPAMLRIPRAKYLAMALLLPAAIANVAPLASYLHARMRWTAYGWGKYFPPSPSAFFELPSVSSIWCFVPALVEEIAWRGYLQPRFIRRYGLVRGIFVVGVVWGAFHLCWDFGSLMTVRGVAVQLIVWLAIMVSVSYVLAWLTIRSNSILPAAIAHAIYNMFIIGGTFPVPNPRWLTILLWSVAGFAVFRFSPPPSPTTVAESPIPPAPEPEPSEV
jgi:membrane protease YdiL (CAAX protease family)